MMRIFCAFAAVAFAAASATAPAAAATVTLKIGNGPGSVFDTTGRLISRHIGKYLPGSPDVVVENATGGGGLLLIRQMENTEPADGSVFGLINSGLISTAILTPEKAPIHPDQLSWIGSMGLVPSVCAVTNRSGINSMADLASADVKMGAGSSPKIVILSSAIKHLIKARFQIIQGFNGMPEIRIAMERGEIDGVCGVTLTSFSALGFADIAKIIGTFDEGVAHNGVPIPLVWPADVSDADRKAVELLVKDEQVYAPLMLPGKTDPVIVAAFREAFVKMIADTEFQADAALGFPNLHPSTGEAVEAMVKELTEADPATVARARELGQ